MDQISVGDLTMHIEIPLYVRKERGSGTDIGVSLVYTGNALTTYPFQATTSQLISGWSLKAGPTVAGSVGVISSSSGVCPSTGKGSTTNWSYTYYDQTGYPHSLPGGSTTDACTGATTSFDLPAQTRDGSGYTLTQANGYTYTVVTPSGGSITNAAGYTGQYIDSNGNATVLDWNPALGGEKFEDTANSSLTLSGGVTQPLTSQTPETPLVIQYHDTNGNTQSVTVSYKVYLFQGSQTVTDYQSLVDSITYADGSAYHFTYEPSPIHVGTYTGRLASIQVPTGGTISYAYTDTEFCNSSYTTTALTRTTPDGATTYTRTLNSVNSNCGIPGSTTNVSTSTSLKSYAFVTTPSVGTYQVSESDYQGTAASGTPLKYSARCYNGATSSCSTGPASLPITEISETTSWNGGPSSKVAQFFNISSLPTEVDEYDFGGSTATRKTLTNYASLGLISNRPSSVVVEDGNSNVLAQTTYGYDEYPLTTTSGLPNHQTVSGSRGNMTSVHKWLNTATSTIDSHYKYDDAGQMLASEDPLTNWTYYEWDAATDQCMTSTTPPTPSSGVSQATSATCDSNTGVVTSVTDANKVKTTFTYDPMLRLNGTSTTTATGAVAASMTRSYSGSSLPETITTTVTATPDPNQVSSTVLDGLGRTATTVAPNGARIDTTYDSMGNVQSVSNSYLTTTDSTYGLTSYLYDALGRKTYQCNPDNSSTFSTTCTPQTSYQQWTYSGNVVTQKDELGNSWARTSDGLGRLTKVTEPNGASATYVYSPLGSLTSVTQSGVAGETARPRSYSYDSLSRLLTASNPETGTVCYGQWSGSNCVNGYDANSNLVAKTDARGVVISYQYDALNRMIAKTGTGINYVYGYDQATNGVFTSSNPIGHLTGASNQVNADIHYSYDAMGRVIHQEGCTPANCGTGSNPVSAGYDLAGNMTSLTYPDGRSVSQVFDGSSHLSSISYSGWNGAAQSVSYLSVASSNGYDAAGHLINAMMGNGIGLAASYNNREEISSLAYGTSAQLLWGKQYSWTANGNLQATSDPLTSIQRQFGYDTLNRLTSAQDIFAASTVADPSPFPIGAGGADGSSVTSDGATAVWTNPDDSNILIDPDQPGASGWEVGNANIANGILAPDGTTTAATFTATSGSTDTFLGAIAAQGSLMDGETMTGSVWLRAPNGSQVIDLYLVEVGTPGNVVTASKQITVTTTWQQFQLSGKFQYGYGDLIFQIGGGGTVKSGQAISLWESKLEDAGTSGIDVTNFLPYSQQVNPQTWGLQAATYSNNSGTAPDGSNTAITVTASSGSTDTWLIDTVQNPAPFGGTPVTGSVWLRSQSGSQNISLTLITTNAGTLGQTTVALTSTWQRFQVSGTTPTTLTELQLQIGGAGTFINGQSIQIWGAQIELANVAGPYVPTDGAPVTIGANLTNLLPYSQEPNGPSWILTNTAGVPNAVAAPDSSMTGYQMTVSSGVTDAWVTNNVMNPALYDGATVTESLFARIPGSTALTVDLYIVADTASGRTYIGPTSMQLNGNWQRFTVHGKLPNGLTSLFLQIGGSGTFSSGQTIDIWGTQLELASSAGPYVMTTAQPVIEGKELTNILPNSQMLSGPSWGVSYGSAVNNAAVAPDGTTTASIVTGTASSPDTYAIHSVPNPSLYDGETVTASVYLRVASGTLNTELFLVNVGDSSWSVTAQVPITLTTTWQRFSITGTNQNGLSQLSLQIGGAGTVTSGASFQVWGAQMVVGSSAAPYIIATSGTTNTATGQAASVAPNGLNQSFTYDSFGNLQLNGSFTSTYTAQNQMFGYAYDAAGNLLSNGFVSMSWDAEGKLSSSGGATYIYNPEGDRVEKQGVGVTDTVYFGGRPIARLSSGAWTDLIYGPSGLLAEVPGTQAATPNYRLLDHLGTQVGTVGSNGLLVNPMDYTPFGQAFSGATSDPYVYTGKERDAESGLDMMGARYYGSSMGRFMSPDPSGLVFASFANPQSLNLYSYAQNNPLIYTDPTGLDCAYLNASGSAIEDGGLDQHSSSGECGKTGGYWVDGSMTNANINANAGTVQLTGTNDGTDATHASYKDTSVYVDSWLNTSLNQAGHITMGLVGQQQVGQNPRSDADFLSNMLLGGVKNNVVPGAIQPETPGQLRSFALVPVTGMQAQMIQNSINQSTAAPPNYSLNPALGLDCATWAQQVLHDAGIQTGPMQPYPNDLMKQLSNQFTVLPEHQ